jgi:acyl-CoA thioesterase FadM
LRLNDEFDVYTRAIARNAKLFQHLHFMVRKRDGELSATCEILGVHIDLATRRSAPLPENVAAELDKLIAAHSKLDWDAPLSGAIHI